MLILRPRVFADLESIVSWVSTPEELYLFTGPRGSWPLTAGQLEELGRQDGVSAWVLVDEGAADSVIGHVDVRFDEGEAFIRRVLVDPLRRGQGLGRALCSLVLEEIWAGGATTVRLNVIRGNAAAVRVYEGLGFIRDGSSEREDVILMVLVRSGISSRPSPLVTGLAQKRGQRDDGRDGDGRGA